MTEMNCQEFEAQSAELALGILDGRERADALAHLEQCPGCRQELLLLSDLADGLVELTPPAEPSAGFETRVLARLADASRSRGAVHRSAVDGPGPLKAVGRAAIAPEAIASEATAPEAISPPGGAAQFVIDESGVGQPGLLQARDSHFADLPGADPGASQDAPLPTDSYRNGGAPPDVPAVQVAGGAARFGRVRSWPRPLVLLSAAVAAVVLAIGGWAVGQGGTSNHHPTAGAQVLTADLWRGQTTVGQVIATTGSHPWLYMVVDAGLNEKSVTCQVREGKATTVTVGSFALENGSGYWTVAIPKSVVHLTGAQLVDATGRTVASATFSTRS